MRFPVTALILAVFTTFTACAQTSPAPSADQLKFTLVLSRHGVRPPLHPAAEINPYAANPWPEWEVPLGHLTPHGGLALQAMGAYMRADLAQNGLFPATGCPQSKSIYLYSDVDERNISSTRSTFAAFAPGCKLLPVHIAAQAPDDIFSSKSFPKAPEDEVKAARAEQARQGIGIDAATQQSTLDLLAYVLAPDPDHQPAKPITDNPMSHLTLIEDLALEYMDAKPMPEVGWGRLDDGSVQKLMRLYAAASSTNLHTPLIARTFASNTALHILDTLQQAAANKPVTGAIGPTGTQLVYVSGHDSNLAALLTVLGIHYTLDTRTDDTPPDTQFDFELWQNPITRADSIRIRVRQQTLPQIRFAAPLTSADPPAETYVIPTGCTSTTTCPLDTFLKAATAALNPTYTRPTLQPEILAP